MEPVDPNAIIVFIAFLIVMLAGYAVYDKVKYRHEDRIIKQRLRERRAMRRALDKANNPQ